MKGLKLDFKRASVKKSRIHSAELRFRDIYFTFKEHYVQHGG